MYGEWYDDEAAVEKDDEQDLRTRTQRAVRENEKEEKCNGQEDSEENKS